MIKDMSWDDHAGYMQQLGQKYRHDVRKEILRHGDKFHVVTTKPQTKEEIRECFDLYNNVFEKSFEMNVHRLPIEFFEAMCQHEEYDVIRLYLKDDEGNIIPEQPVAVMFSHVASKNYTALIVGLDYDFVRSMNTYKQILYRTVMRAWQVGCTSLDLAYTAESVKKKVGARPYKATAYVQLMDHYNATVIANMSQAS